MKCKSNHKCYYNYFQNPYLMCMIIAIQAHVVQTPIVIMEFVLVKRATLVILI